MFVPAACRQQTAKLRPHRNGEVTGTHRHPSSEVILRVRQHASCSCSPPEPRRPPADDWFNPVHLRRRNRDGNEESTGRICDEVRRIAANIAKLPLLTCPRNLIQPAP